MPKLIFLISIAFTIFIISFILLTTHELQESKNKTNTQDNWDDSYHKVYEFISKLNRSEKIDLLYGIKSTHSAKIMDRSI